MARTFAVLVRFEPERLALHQVTEAGALTEVGAAFAKRGFSERLPGFYTGPCDIDAVRASMAVRGVADGFAWFTPCLRSARLSRIEEDGDLAIALE